MNVIVNNGSRETPATVDELIELMAREPLCPRFLETGEPPYEGLARFAKRNPEWNHGSPASVPQWVDGDPIYPDSPDAVRFFGNFADLSHVFCIDTDEPELIERFRSAITSNLTAQVAQP